MTNIVGEGSPVDKRSSKLVVSTMTRELKGDWNWKEILKKNSAMKNKCLREIKSSFVIYATYTANAKGCMINIWTTLFAVSFSSKLVFETICWNFALSQIFIFMVYYLVVDKEQY